jgi:hypothetical protein
MPHHTTLRAILLAWGVALAVAVPDAAAFAQKAPLIDQDIRQSASYLRYWASPTPFVRSLVGVSWDRTVYKIDPTAFVSGIPCVSFAVLWSQCVNNPNDPAVSQLENGSAGVETNTAGELVARQIQTTPFSGANRPTEGSASAKAETEIGSNKVYAAARGGFEREVFFPSYISFQSGGSGGSTKDEHLWLTGAATSIWSDTFTPDFTGPMTIGLSSYLHGSAAEETAYLGPLPGGANRGIETSLQFGVFDPTQTTYYGNEFSYEFDYGTFFEGPRWVTGLNEDLSGFRYGLSPYTVSFDVVAGRSYTMVMSLDAYARQNGLIDMFGTSKVDYFEVPDGGSVSFGGGNFVVRSPGDAGPVDEGPENGGTGENGPIGGGPVSSVPEPSTALLLIPALLVLLMRRRAVRNA